MKKLFALLLAAAMVLSMAACGTDSASSAVSEAPAASEASAAAEAPADDSDLSYIQGKGTLVVGITDFEPMDYKDESGNWIGFDADMASASRPSSWRLTGITRSWSWTARPSTVSGTA